MRPSRDTPTPAATPLVVLTCAVIEDELRHHAADRDHVLGVVVLEQGLHNEPDRLRAELQAAIDRAEAGHPRAEAIVLGYGLCSRGTEGVVARRCRLVVPRAHDCITLLLGCRRRYQEYVEKHPGTYWYSPGWNRCHTPPGPERYQQRYEHYRKTYGEDNAEYLMQAMENWYCEYNRATYVDLGIGVTDEDLAYTRRCADWLGWTFDRQHGSPALIEQLLSGDWPDDAFLVVPPGRTFRLTADDRVIEVASASEKGS